MTTILYAALSSLFSVGQSALTKIASTKETESSVFHFNTLKIGASLTFFLLISFWNLHFHLPTLLFGITYGFSLAFSTLFGYLALMHGSMALTSLIVSYSVTIPCFFGIIFLNEKVSTVQIFGILLLLISIYLIKFKASDTITNKSWIFYVIMTFFCNGICSVIQKLHQTVYPASYCKEFMIWSLLVTFILFAALSAKKKNKISVGSIKYSVVSGVLMGLGNYLTLILSSKLNATVLFPIVSISSMLFNVIVSKLYFKDNYGIMQLFGIGLGVIAILLIK